MRRIGTGFELINFPTVEIDSGDPDIGIYSEIEPTALEKAKEMVEKIKIQRGEIISICTDNDYLLVEGISNFFLEKDSDKRQILQSLI
ncbi:hypothetical protein, partial [Methanoregula sp.]|uniref:hypothetical protein n=1 Tax=Methanoregula sp. TaxID=2052170 RepID=UPI003BAE5209